MEYKDSRPLWRRHTTELYSELLETAPQANIFYKTINHVIRKVLSMPWSSHVVFCCSYPCQKFVFLRNLGVRAAFQTCIVEFVRAGEPWQIPWGLEMNERNRLGICVLGWPGGGKQKEIFTKFE